MTSSSLVKQIELEAEVEKIIAEMRPMLIMHGGDVNLLEITPKGIVKLELLGACDDCALADLTLNEGLKERIMLQCEAITDVVSVKE